MDAPLSAPRARQSIESRAGTVKARRVRMRRTLYRGVSSASHRRLIGVSSASHRVSSASHHRGASRRPHRPVTADDPDPHGRPTFAPGAPWFRLGTRACPRPDHLEGFKLPLHDNARASAASSYERQGGPLTHVAKVSRMPPVPRRKALTGSSCRRTPSRRREIRWFLRVPAMFH
jgi:hypothetical protein